MHPPTSVAFVGIVGGIKTTKIEGFSKGYEFYGSCAHLGYV